MTEQSTDLTHALFAMQEQLRNMYSVLTGEVEHLKSNGWSDEQARAIVAFSFGWRPASGEKPEGID